MLLLIYCIPAALQPSDITAFFEPIFEQAKDLRRAYSRFSTLTKMPFITVSNAMYVMLGYGVGFAVFLILSNIIVEMCNSSNLSIVERKSYVRYKQG